MLDILFEKNLVINNRELKYKGIFRADELFHVINKSLREKRYHKREKKSEETVTEQGRKTFVELRPYKHKTSYMVLMIKIKITLDNVTETVQEFQGQKQKFQQGDVSVVFDSWLMSEYEHRWTMKPWVYFLKSLINKYVYHWPIEAGFSSELVNDTAFIYAQIRNLLHSYGTEVGKIIKEEDIRKDVGIEIEKELREEGAVNNKSTE